jgi:hypothetical protein
MARILVPSLQIKRSTVVRKLRELPVPGEVLVAEGSAVQSGDVVARTFLPGDLHILRIAEKLGVEAFEVMAGLVVKQGEQVRRGQLLCEHAGIFGLFKSRYLCPCEGLVEFVMEKTGHVGVREAARPIEIKAYLSGRVAAVEARKSVLVECRGALIQGIFGVGGEREGVMRMLEVEPGETLQARHIPESCAGMILAGGCRPELEAIRKAAQGGAAGLVVGSIDDGALSGYLGYDLGIALTGDEDIGMTVVVTEGFGRIPISQRTLKLLGEFSGARASLNGATQVRAGAVRPEVVVCHNDERLADDAAPDDAEAGLSLGRAVRIIRVPYFGARGSIVELPYAAERIETGALARVLRVKLEGGEVVTVPRANVEV